MVRALVMTEQHCKPKSFTRLHGPLIFSYHTEIDVPIFEVCAVYDIQNKTLQMIESSWTEMVCVNKLTWRFLATDSILDMLSPVSF